MFKNSISCSSWTAKCASAEQNFFRILQIIRQFAGQIEAESVLPWIFDYKY